MISCRRVNSLIQWLVLWIWISHLSLQAMSYSVCLSHFLPEVSLWLYVDQMHWWYFLKLCDLIWWNKFHHGLLGLYTFHFKLPISFSILVGLYYLIPVDSIDLEPVLWYHSLSYFLWFSVNKLLYITHESDPVAYADKYLLCQGTRKWKYWNQWKSVVITFITSNGKWWITGIKISPSNFPLSYPTFLSIVLQLWWRSLWFKMSRQQSEFFSNWTRELQKFLSSAS